MPNDIDNRRLRAGIVGGGEGSMIGAVHRIASQLDNQALVVAGAMSSHPEKAKASAAAWFLARSYDDFAKMAAEEARHPEGIDFVIVATPNHMHYPVAKVFLEAGIHVVSDKPMTFNLEQARELSSLVERGKSVFALTHNYTGYPAVRQAREMARNGSLGVIRKVIVEYLQDWLSEPLEQAGQKQAGWRTNPAQAGISCCVADIGTHGENLLEYITGLKIESLCADLSSFVPGRRLDDDAKSHALAPGPSGGLPGSVRKPLQGNLRRHPSGRHGARAAGRLSHRRRWVARPPVRAQGRGKFDARRGVGGHARHGR